MLSNYDGGSIKTQKDLFKDEWIKRRHKCSVCREPLPIYSPYWMAHVLGKGAFPAFKLLSGNIRILCGTCHDLYDKQTHVAKKDPRFKELFEFQQELIVLYNLTA